MEQYCKNCNCILPNEEDGVVIKSTNNSPFCLNCQNKILPFLKFVVKSNTSAISLLEVNKDRLLKNEVTDEGLKYIYKYCKHFDEKRYENSFIDPSKVDDVKQTQKITITSKKETRFPIQKIFTLIKKKSVKIASFSLLLLVSFIVLIYFFAIRPKNINENIIMLMDAGDYIEAQKLLEKTFINEESKSLQEQIKYESFTLKCMEDLKKYMKNPTSLQVNSIRYFEGNESSIYPIIITTTSGQNGLGGYSIGYELFSDLTYTGSCTSLDEDDYDTSYENDQAELLICLIINTVYEGHVEIQTEVDLRRLNNILLNNVSYKIDVNQYANTITTSDSSVDIPVI